MNASITKKKRSQYCWKSQRNSYSQFQRKTEPQNDVCYLTDTELHFLIFNLPLSLGNRIHSWSFDHLYISMIKDGNQLTTCQSTIYSYEYKNVWVTKRTEQDFQFLVNKILSNQRDFLCLPIFSLYQQCHYHQCHRLTER